MDKDKLDNDGSEEEKSEKYLWLAALIIGIFLILMLLAIAGIVIWKHFRKQNTTDQNWAGPSPLADGNMHEQMNINECILGRQRSLSCISTAPIVSNELQAEQNCHVSEKMPQGNSEASTQKDDRKTNIMPTQAYISSETTSFSSDAPEGEQSKQQLQDYSLNDETSLPPPPDYFLQLPMPPQIDELPVIDEERNLQPLPLTNLPQNQDHHHQTSLFQANTVRMTDSLHSTCDIDDQFLPPPPADL